MNIRRMFAHVLFGRPRMLGVVLSYLIIAGSSVSRGDELSKVRAAFDFARSARATIHVEEVKTSRLQSEPVTSREDIRCLRDGDRWGVQITSPLKNEPGLYYQTNFVFRDDKALQFNSVRDRDGGLDQKSDRGVTALLYSPSIAGTREERDRIWPAGGNVDLVCFGILDGQPLCSPDGLLADAKVVGKEAGLVKVEASSQFGELVLWCDPERDYLPRRAEFIQTPECYSGGRKIADIDMNAGNVWPAGRIKEVRWSVDLDHDQIDSGPAHSYIKGWRIIKQTDCEAGVTVSAKIDAKVGSFEPGASGNPADFLFGLEVPKLLPVQVVGANHLNYLWDGDWAAPAGDSLAPSGLAARGSVRWILVVASLAVLLVVGVALVLRNSRKTSAENQQ